MNLIRSALRKPITILVLVASLFFFGINAVRTIKIDIFPNLNLPVIYISQPFGGYTPNQMESLFGKPYVNLLLYVSGVKSIETKNIQSLTLIKLTFYEGTNMAQAAAEVSAYSNRAQAILPPGTQPPFILRFDASTLPIGQLVLSSPKRTNNELQDLANVYIRPGFTAIPGLVTPAPFGGNSRTVVIKVDPELMRSHNLTPDQLVAALRINNQATPSGNVRVGDLNYFAPTNTNILEMQDFGNIPLYTGTVQNLYLKDVATIEDGADITQGYVLVNGKRSIYMPITKSADASTWEVVQNLKAALPRFQALLPEDVKMTYTFDQSVYVINAVKSLMTEGVIGAILTGLMVLLFLGDLRGALIVIITIPTCIIAGVLFLKLFGQTINIMTLSGLALAVGILVDESTVTIENIHQHMDMGKPKALAIWDACKEIAFSKLLILFCILAVFAPAFTMSGIPGALFLPLALSISFSMITSYLMAQTLVPVLSNWMMREEHPTAPGKAQHPAAINGNGQTTNGMAKLNGNGHASQRDLVQQKEKLAHRIDLNNDQKIGFFERMRARFVRFIGRMLPYRRPIVIGYIIGGLGIAALMITTIGRDVLPKANESQFQVRLRAPDGTRLEKTELIMLEAEGVLNKLVGKENIAITSAMVGLHGAQFSTSPIYLFMAGPQEGVLQVALKEDFDVDIDALKDRFRASMKKALPDVKLSFEPIELTDKILSQGSPTPIEVRVLSKNKKQNEEYADKMVAKLKQIPYLRDVQIGQATRYPTLNVTIDRTRAAQLGSDIASISRSLIAATSSSRYTDKSVWIDPKSAQSYSVQLQIPENQMKSVNDMAEIPIMPNTNRPVLGDVATIEKGTTYGENDNVGAMPVLSVTANIRDKDLGTAITDVQKAINSVGELPRGLTIKLQGLSEVLTETLKSLQDGLLVAVVVIFLMLAANFQSFKVSLVVLCTVPAVLVGALSLLMLTGATLNLQSYMGMIMSVGVSISNAVLMVTNAEEIRMRHGNALLAAQEAASLRMRPILMTSVAMVVGMIPMASGLGEGGSQSAPLGRAVIGGLVASTFAALFILPLVFAWVQGKTTTDSVSLDPEDQESKFYIPAQYESVNQ